MVYDSMTENREVFDTPRSLDKVFFKRLRFSFYRSIKLIVKVNLIEGISCMLRYSKKALMIKKLKQRYICIRKFNIRFAFYIKHSNNQF